MAVAILRPNGDINATWSVTGATSRWDAIDDAVTSPTAASATERIFIATSGVSQDVDLTTITGIGTVSQAVIWFFASTAGNDRVLASLWTAGGTQIGTTSAATNLTATYTWYSHTITGLALSQTDIDGLRLRLTSGASGGMSEVRVAAAYVEITYEAPYTPVIEGAYATAVAAIAGLAGYWRFGESSGTTAYDDSGNDRRGTISGATLGAAGLLTADTNTAFTYDGVNDSVLAPHNAGLIASNITIVVWVKTPNAGTGPRIIVGKPGDYMLFADGGNVGLYDETANLNLMTGVSINDDARHMIAVTIQSGVTNGAKVYIDNTLRLTATNTFKLLGLGLGIGFHANGNGQFFTGIIDEPAIYTAILSDAALADLYAKGTSGGSVSATAGFTVSSGASSAPAMSAIVTTPASAAMVAASSAATAPQATASGGASATILVQTSATSAPAMGATAGGVATFGVQTSAATAPAVSAGISALASLLAASVSSTAPNASTSLGALASFLVASSGASPGTITATAEIAALAHLIAAASSGTSPAMSATVGTLATLLASTSPVSAPPFAATAGASLLLAAASSGGSAPPVVATGGSLAALLASTVPITAPSVSVAGGAFSSLAAASSAASAPAIVASALVAIAAQMVAAVGGLSSPALAAVGGSVSALAAALASFASPPIDGLVGTSALLVISSTAASTTAVTVILGDVASLVVVTSAGAAPLIIVLTGARAPLQVASGGAIAPAFTASEYVIAYYPWPERTVTTLVPDGPATVTTPVGGT